MSTQHDPAPHRQAENLSNPSAVNFNNLGRKNLREKLFKWHCCQGAQRTNYSKLVKSGLLKWDSTCIKQRIAAVTAGSNVCIFKDIIIGSWRTEICDTDLNRLELDLNAVLITGVSSDTENKIELPHLLNMLILLLSVFPSQTHGTGGSKTSCNLQMVETDTLIKMGKWGCEYEMNIFYKSNMILFCFLL